MPEELELEQEEVELESDDSELEFEEDGDSSDEPFLSVGRSTYRDRDSAIKGISEKDNRIAQYSRYGSPEEIEQRLNRYAAMEKAFEALNPSAQKSNGPDPYEGLQDPDARKQWDAAFKRWEAYAVQNGYVRKDDLEKDIESRIQQQVTQRLEYDRRIDTVRNSFKDEAKRRGINPDMKLVEQTVINLANSEGEEEFRQAFWQGDPAEFAKLAAKRLFGEYKAPQAAAPDPNRDKYAATKEKTKTLPKPPPKGQTASVESEDPDRVAELKKTRNGRLKLAAEVARRAVSS